MNNEHSLAEKTVVDLLDKFESKKYQELIESAWNVLYTVIIPFNIEGIHLLLSNYIIILSQALSIESIQDEATRILSIIDLIIHPRKGTIIEGKNEFDDIITEPVEIPSPDNNNDSLDSDKTKKVKISIIE
ncbi:hypothetical protein NEIG_02414 [Nematocida sp. ERTm5]|nr:hypothetical protein NEIRO02_1931 [Nematocida sp. AWRm79]KAI5184159.1 hypothetical protein NEIRO03_1615 [Nematocida sp. AWRm78]OAG32837.1 hypothetical protein NEIG_02414 [Nematocida sp. ERTm5]